MAAAGVAFGHGPPPMVADDVSLLRVQVGSLEELAALEEAGAEPWACRPGVGVQLMSAPRGLADRLEADGATVVARDLAEMLDASLAAERGGGFFDNYQTFGTIDARLDELAMNPRVELFEVGLTLEGRMVRGIRITAPGAAGPKPGVLVNGAQHAREWISPASVMWLAEALIDGYGVDADVTSALDGVDFYLVPVVNADGYAYSWTPGNRQWRKNRRPNPGGSFGVDPNRNWAEGWGLSSGSSGSQSSSTYRGPTPFSEPCTANLRDFIISRPEIRAHVDVHNFAQLVLGAWAYTNTPAPEPETLLPLGEAISDAIVAENGVFYDFRTGAGGIGLASGAMPDWTFGELGVMSWTFELRDTGNFGFLLPASQIVPTSEESAAGILRLANQIAQCPSDLNVDGVVDAGDLAIILTRWGSQRGLADTDLSGVVDAGDLASMLAAWGSSCGL